jgi:hypothetical protein
VPHVVESEQQQDEEDGAAFQFVYQQDGVHYFKHGVVYELDDTIGRQ